jgi:large repetitive protein
VTPVSEKSNSPVPSSAGGGTNGSVVNYWLTGAGVSESGQLGLGGGVLAPAGTRHYGVSLTLQVQVCDLYPGGDPICSGMFTKPLGTPVSTQLTGARYDPTTRSFSWTGWPTGAYDYVRFSCDGGATRTDMPAVGQTPTCTVTPTETDPTIIVYVGADGIAYEHSWRSADLG